jgi:hypothetical protein
MNQDRSTGCLLLFFLLSSSFIPHPSSLRAADEADCRDGRRLPGTLTLAPDGRLSFTPPSGQPPPAGDLARVRLEGPAPPPLRTGRGRRILLTGGQQLTGEFLGTDGTTLVLRTAAAGRLDVARSALTAVTTLPGWRPLFADDFAAGLGAWAVTGKPAAGGEPPAVVLDAPGQALACTPPAPVPAGRVGVNFEGRDHPGGGRWDLELSFPRGGAEPLVVRVTVAGAGENYEVAVPGLGGEARAVARAPGWHRLVVQFSPGSLRVTCDDAVLWYTLRQGPGGALGKVRLSCRAADATAVHGAVAWADCALEQAVDEPPRPEGDPTQDEVELFAGDQLFGKVAGIDRRGIAFRGRAGAQTLPWAEVRGCWFRRAGPPPRTTDGAHVRLGLASGLAPDLDALDGVLSALDGRRLTLRHAFLGELRLDRACVREVRPLFFGRRVELDNTFHHLGDPQKLDPSLDPPRAEGPACRWTFELAEVPAEVRLVLTVVSLSGAGDAGGRTEVVVNGRRVDYLNRQADRGARGPRTLAVPLPRDALRGGENVVELRTGPRAHCGLWGLALELPR